MEINSSLRTIHIEPGTHTRTIHFVSPPISLAICTQYILTKFTSRQYHKQNLADQYSESIYLLYRAPPNHLLVALKKKNNN